jgi:autotransporter-associated beta strand protein
MSNPNLHKSTKIMKNYKLKNLKTLFPVYLFSERKPARYLVPFLFLLFFGGNAYGQATFESNQTGNWSSTSSWNLTSGSDGDDIPDSNDTVIILSNHTITVNTGSQACSQLTVGPTGSNISTLSFANGTTLTVGGTVSLGNSGNNNRRGTINMTNGGTLKCTGFVLNNSGSNVFTSGTGTVELTATNTLPNAIFTSFNNLIIAAGTTTTGRALTIASLTVNSADTFSLSHAVTANAVSLEGGCSSTGGTISGSSTLTLGGNVAVTDNGGGTAGATISCPVALGATRTFTIADDGTSATDLTMSGVISGSTFGLTKDGAGTLRLSGSNTYTGTTTISEGTISAATIVVSSSASHLGNATSAIVLGGSSTSGSLSYTGSAATFTRGFTVNAGGGSIINTTANLLTIGTRGIATTGAVTLSNTSTGGTTISSVISSTGSVVINNSGAGVTTLSGTNTYSGGTTLSARALTIGNTSALGSTSGAFTISGTGTATVSSNVSVGALTIGGLGTASGTWGSSTSSATNKSNVFLSTGLVTVGTNTRITPTVTPTVGTYTYNGAAQGPNVATNTGNQTSYTFSYEGTGDTTYAASATRPTNAGSYTVTASVAANGNYNSASSSATAFTIDKAPLTITGVTVASKVYDKTNTATLNTGSASLTGVVGDDVVTINSTGATGTFASVNAGSGISVAATGFSLGGADAANYDVTLPTGLTGTITARPITLTGTREYDGTDVALASDVTISNNLDGANLTLTGSGTISLEDVGVRTIANANTLARIQSATGNTGGNTQSNFAVTLTSAPTDGNTLVAVISTRSGSSNTVSSISQTGTTWTRATQSTNFWGVTTEIWYAPARSTSGAGVFITLSTSNTRSSAAVMEYSGVLALNPLDVANGNANFATNTSASTNSITTNQANELIIAAIGVNSSGVTLSSIQNSFSLVATSESTNGSSSNNSRVFALERMVTSAGSYSTGATLSSSRIWAASIASFKASIPSGTAFTLGGSAAGNYTLTNMTGTMTVTPKALSITAPSIASKEYDGLATTGEVTVGTLSGVVNPETLTVSATGTYADANVGNGKTATVTYTLANGTNGGLAANYSLASGSGTGNITAAKPTVTVTVGTYTFTGSPQGPISATNTGTGSSYTFSYVGTSGTTYGPTATRPTAAGTYTATATVAANGNFASANSDATSFSITTKDLTITANNATKCFGETYTLGNNAFTSSGLQNGETIGSVTLTSTGAASGGIIGTHPIIPSAATGGNFVASNYSITYTNGTLTVNALPTVNAGTAFTKTCVANTSGAAIGETAEAGHTYSWSPSTGLSSATASNPTANPTTTTTYTVTKTNTASGCTATGTVTVTVNNSAISVNAGTAFTKTCVANASGAAIGETAVAGHTYSWSPSTGLSSATASNPTANPSSTTTYTVTKTNTASGCTATGTVTVTVNNSAISVNAGTAFTKTCVANTSGAAIGETAVAGHTYSWSPSTGLSSATASNPTANPSSTTTYTVTKTNTASGCTATGTVIVTVNNSAISVNAGTAFTKTCVANTSGAAIGETADAGNTYSWSPSTGLSSATASNPTANPTTTTTYTVTKTNTASGCTATGTVAVTVDNQAPTVTVSVNQSICAGSSATITASGATSYVWSNSLGTASSVTVSPSTTTTYNVTGTDANGCTNTASTTVTVNPNLPASVSVGASATTICSGASVTFTATPTNGGATPSYQWKLNGSNVGSDSATYNNSALANNDAVSVIMTSTATCAIDSPATSNTVTITVSTALVAPTSATANVNTICGSGSTTLTLTGGDSQGATIKWYTSSCGETLVGTGNNLVVSPTSTTTYYGRYEGGCDATSCASVTITFISATTTTWNGTTWSNGEPTESTAAIISGTFTSPGTNPNYNLRACKLTVNAGATVLIKSGDSVILDGALIASPGSFVTFNSGANLIQFGTTNDNTGAIVIKRESSSLLKRLDYTLWSSPVAGQGLQAFSPNTLSNRFYSYNSSTDLYQAVNPSATTFSPFNGYLIRTPNTHPTTPASWTGQFTGVPNNGNYSMTFTGFRLIGNPYPSAIDADAFIEANISVNGNDSTFGTLYFWRKPNGSQNGAYVTKTLGGVAGDRSILNHSQYSSTPNNVIQVGQGFIVRGKGTSNVVFTNDMRTDSRSNRFFRTANTIERNRIWLNITNAAGSFSQAMIAYMTGATQGVDNAIDGELLTDGDVYLASLIGTASYTIQGRALPFDMTDVVPMSFKVTTAGDYTITIDSVDGLFSNGAQTVYLRDNTTGVLHNLSAGAYTFTSASGTFDTRFEIVYRSSSAVSTPVVTSIVGSYIYNGSPQGPDAATNTGIGTSYTFIYEGTGSTIYAASSIAPTNAGTYTVTTTVASTGNYASASSSATPFTIEAATPVVTSTVESYTYSGSPQGPNAATNTGTGTSYTFTYEGTGNTIYAPSSIAPTNAGTYTVTATVEATGNYASASSSATAFTIVAATPVVTSTVESYIYNGSLQGPDAATNTGTGTSYTFTYEGTGNTIYAPSSIAPTNAGTYTVTATVEATGNYASASSSATAFTITAKPLTITALDYSKCEGVNYVLPSNGYSIEGLVGSQSIDNVTLSSTGNPSNSVVGTYPIVAQNALGGSFANSNYSITYIDGTLTVDPLSVGGTASASSTSVLSGNSTTITLTGYTGTIQWQSSNDGDSWTDEVGATQNTYTTPVLTQTVHYRALVTSGECSSVLSSSVVIAVDSAALAVPTFNESQVVIYKTPTNEISINTGNVVMSKVKIFDIRGRLLQEQKDINASQTYMNAGLTTEILLVQITSEEGLVVTKKVLFPRTSLKLDKNLKEKTQLAEDE